MLNTNPTDHSDGQNTSPIIPIANDSLHDDNMDSYVQYVDQIKSDSQEYTKQKLETISDNFMNNIRFGKDDIDLILGYINLRLEDEISDDNRDDLCTIAEFLMIDPNGGLETAVH